MNTHFGADLLTSGFTKEQRDVQVPFLQRSSVPVFKWASTSQHFWTIIFLSQIYFFFVANVFKL